MTEGNIFDYLDWRGDLTFRQSGLNAIDALIFASLTYINYPVPEDGDILLRDAYSAWKQLPETEKFRGIAMMHDSCMKLADVIGHYKRFDDVRITRYVETSSEETEKQFSAMTFILPNKILFLAYRGTDNTLVGWKEDFNMAFTSGTPAQLEATCYAERIASEFPDLPMQLGGHSKGGNLSVWAAVHLDPTIKSRIKHVYNLDGPGFTDRLTESPEYREIEGKILSFVPESSVVGVLMGCCDYLTIKSDSVSIFQHHPFSWKIVGRSFVYETERSILGKKIEKMLNDMINTMDKEELSELIESMYADFRRYDEKTLTDLRKHLLQHVFLAVTKVGRFKMRSDARQRDKELREQIDKM